MVRNKGFLRNVLRLKTQQFYKISLKEFRVDSNQRDKPEVCRGGIDVNIVIRKIESKDYISVAAIWRDVLGILSATDETVIKTFEKMKGDSRYSTFVADVNSHVVGFVTTVETLAIDQPNGYIKINGLAVLPEFQHCDVGKMLMECVEKLASERNISLIGLASGFQRTGAHEFYERLGYQKLSFYFRKRI